MNGMGWNEPKIPVAGMLLVALLLLSGYALMRTWPLLFPDVVTTLQSDPDCSLRAGPCITTLSEGVSVSFAIEPRTIPVLQPLQLAVELEGLEARKVEVDFSGADMTMGINRVNLRQQSARRFTGQGSLSVCVRDAMQWEASVFVHTPEETLVVPFRFIVVKPGAI